MGRESLSLLVRIGDEVCCLFAHKERGEAEQARLKAGRTLEIIRELFTRLDVGAGGRAEMSILQDVVCDAVSGRPILSISRKDMESHFMPFALRLMSM